MPVHDTGIKCGKPFRSRSFKRAAPLKRACPFSYPFQKPSCGIKKPSAAIPVIRHALSFHPETNHLQSLFHGKHPARNGKALHTPFFNSRKNIRKNAPFIPERHNPASPPFTNRQTRHHPRSKIRHFPNRSILSIILPAKTSPCTDKMNNGVFSHDTDTVQATFQDNHRANDTSATLHPAHTIRFWGIMHAVTQKRWHHGIRPVKTRPSRPSHSHQPQTNRHTK